MTVTVWTAGDDHLVKVFQKGRKLPMTTFERVLLFSISAVPPEAPPMSSLVNIAASSVGKSLSSPLLTFVTFDVIPLAVTLADLFHVDRVGLGFTGQLKSKSTFNRGNNLASFLTTLLHCIS